LRAGPPDHRHWKLNTDLAAALPEPRDNRQRLLQVSITLEAVQASFMKNTPGVTYKSLWDHVQPQEKAPPWEE
jgi:hypothetical protein